MIRPHATTEGYQAYGEALVTAPMGGTSAVAGDAESAGAIRLLTSEQVKHHWHRKKGRHAITVFLARQLLAAMKENERMRTALREIAASGLWGITNEEAFTNIRAHARQALADHPNDEPVEKGDEA